MTELDLQQALLRVGDSSNEETRREYRNLIVTTHDLGESISGAILYDEAIRRETNGGIPFAKALFDAGTIPGIMVDLARRLERPFPETRSLRGWMNCESV